jgi:hypothetical protein
MRTKIIGFLKLIRDFFFRKKRISVGKTVLFPKKFVEVYLPNHYHSPSLGVHRIRDTPRM